MTTVVGVFRATVAKKWFWDCATVAGRLRASNTMEIIQILFWGNNNCF